MNRKSLAIGMIIPLAAAGAVATAPAASATHEEDDGVTRTGFCDRPVDRLTLNATAFTNAAGKHKIELTLNFSTRKQRAINRDWTAVLRRTNPSQLIERDEDVDFTGVGVRRKYQLTETVANKPGVDHFRARVFNDLDQECVVKLNFRPTDDDDSEG